MKLTDLKPAAYNPRTITDEQLERLKKSLKEFGDLSGIVPITGYPNYYCTPNGKIISHRRVKPIILKPKVDRDGYLSVVLYSLPNVRHYLQAHQIIAISFLSPRPDGMCVNHKNGDKQDNRVENLEWLTPADNERHARKILGKRCLGEKASQSKLKTDDVQKIKKLLKTKLTQQKIADIMGVSQSQIGRIYRGVNWGHVID